MIECKVNYQTLGTDVSTHIQKNTVVDARGRADADESVEEILIALRSKIDAILGG